MILTVTSGQLLLTQSVFKELHNCLPIYILLQGRYCKGIYHIAVPPSPTASYPRPTFIVSFVQKYGNTLTSLLRTKSSIPEWYVCFYIMWTRCKLLMVHPIYNQWFIDQVAYCWINYLLWSGSITKFFCGGENSNTEPVIPGISAPFWLLLLIVSVFIYCPPLMFPNTVQLLLLCCPNWRCLVRKHGWNCPEHVLSTEHVNCLLWTELQYLCVWTGFVLSIEHAGWPNYIYLCMWWLLDICPTTQSSRWSVSKSVIPPFLCEHITTFTVNTHTHHW